MILEEIKSILASPDAWTKEAIAQTVRGGQRVDPESPDATCWCLIGAHQYAQFRHSIPESSREDKTIAAIRHVLDGRGVNIPIATYNDLPDTRHEDIMSLLDDAIAYHQSRHQ